MGRKNLPEIALHLKRGCVDNAHCTIAHCKCVVCALSQAWFVCVCPLGELEREQTMGL